MQAKLGSNLSNFQKPQQFSHSKPLLLLAKRCSVACCFLPADRPWHLSPAWSPSPSLSASSPSPALTSGTPSSSATPQPNCTACSGPPCSPLGPTASRRRRSCRPESFGSSFADGPSYGTTVHRKVQRPPMSRTSSRPS